MGSYNTNEGMGVSIQQNVIMNNKDDLTAMLGNSYKNSIRPSVALRNYYKTQGKSGYSTRQNFNKTRHAFNKSYVVPIDRGNKIDKL